MTLHPGQLPDLALLAQGEAGEVQQNLFGPQVRAAVRYADPLAWIAATAIGRALAHLKSWGPELQHSAALITISPHAPAETICSIAQAAAEGFSSPLRYPAANPGSLAGVSCIAHGLRGPTMNITMPVPLGIPVALLLATSWLSRQHLPLAALLACGCTEPGKYAARCLLLAPKTAQSVEPLTAAHIQWISATPSTPALIQGTA